MPRAFLTATGADEFRTRLVSFRKSRGWSVAKVSQILGCSRRNASYLMKPAGPKRVKAAYAVKLARHLGQECSLDVAGQFMDGVAKIRKDWAQADQPAARRRVARRLEGYLSEYAVVAYGLVTESKLRVSSLANPTVLQLLLKPPNSNQAGVLQINFDTRDRSELPMLFVTGTETVTYNGHLSFIPLQNILRTVKSWQVTYAKPRKGQVQSSTAPARSRQTT